MKYISTRHAGAGVSASEAIVRGIAPDGGLFVPAGIPQIDDAFISSLRAMTYRERAAAILGLFLTDFSAEELAGITRD